MALHPYKAWIAAAGAGIVWIIVGLFIWYVNDTALSRDALQEHAALAQSSESSVFEMRTLARDTKDVRTELDSLSRTDVGSMVDAIDKVGTDLGVKISIEDATPEGALVSDSTKSIHHIDFTVKAEGSFSSLFKTASLLATLPVPAAVEGLNFSRSSDTGPGASPWKLVARLRAFTTADL